MKSNKALILLCIVFLSVEAGKVYDKELGRELEENGLPGDLDNNEPQVDEVPNHGRNLQTVKYGMTWGYRGYTPVAQETFGVHCYGSPVIPKYAPWQSSDGGCNAYRGDTPCNHSLPILCISKCGYKRPCYSINCNSYAMNKEFYCGWSEGFIALSDAVLGSQLSSRAVADRLCAAKYGANFVMAEHHDGKWVTGMDDSNYCYDTWPSSTSGGGWGFYGYGVKGPVWTRFWVAINDQKANCWS
jgi:hypothetical protein